MFSRVCRQRDSFSMIDSTVAVHTKGLGSSFQAARNSRIAFFRSPTLKKAPRRIHCRDSSLNQRSTKFSQLELVGNEMKYETRMFFQPGLNLLLFVGAIVVHHQV